MTTTSTATATTNVGANLGDVSEQEHQLLVGPEELMSNVVRTIVSVRKTGDGTTTRSPPRLPGVRTQPASKSSIRRRTLFRMARTSINRGPTLSLLLAFLFVQHLSPCEHRLRLPTVTTSSRCPPSGPHPAGGRQPGRRSASPPVVYRPVLLGGRKQRTCRYIQSAYTRCDGAVDKSSEPILEGRRSPPRRLVLRHGVGFGVGGRL